MFAAIMLRGLWFAAVNGFCYYEPFIESMPFDPRAGLWEVATQKDWQEQVARYGGQDTQLKSWHEFIAAEQPELDLDEDGAFQRLLFVGFHGPPGIRALEKIDKSHGNGQPVAIETSGARSGPYAWKAKQVP